MDKKEQKEQFVKDLKELAAQKRVSLSDEMLDNVNGGYYTNWNELDRKTQRRLQQESVTALQNYEYCEIFNNDSGVEYKG